MGDRSVSRRTFLTWAAAASTAMTWRGPSLALPAVPGVDEYDDGSSEVPGGVTGDPERVLIIGAGIAGLTAANALANAGVDCIVLEGRTRPGGRAWTRRVGGAPFDQGCSWIHDPAGNPMTRFALQAGVLQTPADIELDLPTMRFFDGTTGEVPLTEALGIYAHFLRFDEEAMAISNKLGPGSSVRDGILYYLNDKGLVGDVRRRTEYFLRFVAELTDGTDWDRLSLWWGARYETPYLGVGQGNFPRGGYVGIVEALAGATNVRFGHRVTSIVSSGSGVAVSAETSDGGRVRTLGFRGSHVIVTLPLGVLKAGGVRFAPSLPDAKRQAMERLWFGQVEKVTMMFSSPFWESDAHTHIVHLSSREAMEFPIFLDYHRLNASPALVAFTGASFARSLDELPAAEVRARTLDVLRRIFGPAATEPADVAVTNWWKDPLALGSYTSIPVGSSPADLDEMSSPVDGRVLFAGEATSRARYGYADGALSSGVREAKRLLRRPSVRLRAHGAVARLLAT